VSRRDLAVVVAASLAFATSGPLGKVAASLPATLTASARTGLAALVLTAAAPRTLLRSLAALSASQRAGVALAGAVLGAHFALFLGGLAATSLVAAVSLISLEPLSVVLAAFVAFRIWPTRKQIVGLALATAGAVVIASGAGAGEHRLAGDVMVFGSVVLYGVYVAIARGLRNAMPATPYAAAVYGTASFVLLPIAVPASLGHSMPSATVIASVVALALVPTLIGHTLVQWAARHAPPAVVALVSPGETLGAIAIGVLVMGTVPSVHEAAGAVLVLVGATVATSS
jgi:drug/metabolite transporter (DMT)-like permease